MTLAGGGPSALGVRFEVRGIIGSGRLGTVYRALDRTLEVDVALKVLRDDLFADDVGAVRRAHPSGQRWTLLAGAPDALRALFPQGRGLLLVDGELRIRGRYDGSGPAAIDAALRDAALVIAR